MTIKTRTEGGVATLEIARPEKKNALTESMYQAMADAVTAAVADEGVRALLITGQPGAFTAGNDLQDFMARPPASEDAPVFRFMRALATCDKPVVAAVTGVAVGIGTTMLLHCDLVYVSDDARLAMPFVSLGLVPEFASSLLVPRLMGHVRASEKLLLGEPMTGAEAVTLGIANAVLPSGEVLAHARRMADRFNHLAPGAVRATKRLLRAAVHSDVVRTLHEEGVVFVERLRSPEAREAFQAFSEKRKPDFSRIPPS
jgi:enoyl-CoA hydratase/carnithine racemase